MNKYIAEFIGSLFFMFVIIYTGNPLAIGLALTVCIIIASKISGGHFNPAVSVMMVAANKLPSTDLIPYVLAQIGGGLCAYEIYKRLPKK
jgi:glycerol uptake facilitator-like aquaporin